MSDLDLERLTWEAHHYYDINSEDVRSLIAELAASRERVSILTDQRDRARRKIDALLDSHDQEGER